mgnify:CR=1 FL=1
MKASRNHEKYFSGIFSILTILTFFLAEKANAQCSTLKAYAGRDTSVCAGMNFTLGGSPSASGGKSPYTYLWTTTTDTVSSKTSANPTASPYTTSIYILKVTDDNNCTAFDTITITAGTCNVVCSGATGPNLLGAMGTFSTPYISPNNSTSASCIRNGTPEAPLDNIGNPKPTQTSYVYSQTSGGLGPEGRYTFVKKLGNGSAANCLHNDFRGEDHTGDGGYFMAINGSPNQAQFGATFFRMDSIPVCANTDYEFSAWLANLKTGMQTHAAGSFPNIAFFINNVIVAYSGPIPPTNGQWNNNWIKAGGTWHSGNTTHASIRIDNYTFVAFGNDLALDDIHFQVCGPVIISKTSKTTYCVGEQVIIRDSVACTNGQPYSWYRWQRSLDGGNTWSNISNIQSSNNSAYYPVSLPPFTATMALNNSKYRVVVSLDSSSLADPNSGCLIIGDATTINVRTAPTVTLQNTDTLCYGTSKTYTPIISGGQNPFTSTWTNLGNGSTTNSNALSLSLTNTVKYSVKITDANQCTAQDTITVALAPTITFAKNVSSNPCVGSNTATIKIVPTSIGAPFQFNWSTGAQIDSIKNLANGKYTVTITNHFACTAKDSTIISAVTNTLTANGTTDSVKCFGNNTGKITLSVSGGTPSYTYVWSNGSSTKDIQNLAAGNYAVTVRDANNCSATKSFTVAQPNAALTANGTTDSVKCFGNNTGKITLSVSGGTPSYTYVWSNGSSTKDIQNLAAGNYAVTVRDANNCSATRAFTVAQPNAALTANGTTDSVKCFGNNTGKITLSVSGGTPIYTYVWSNGSSTKDIQNLAAGNYAVTVRDANNCSATKSFTVAQPNAALTANGTTDSVKCFGNNTGKITLSVSGGTPSYTYVWSNGSSTKDIQNLAAGNYAVTVRDANNCSATRAFTVAQPNAALTANGTTDSVKCFGNNTGKITLSVSGGTPIYTYVWSNGSSTKDIQNLAAGNYAVTVRDANNCSATRAFTVAQPNAALTANGTTDSVKCFGNNTGKITLSVSGGTLSYTYVWSNGSSTKDIQNLASGNYTVTVRDANNCSATKSFTVAQPNATLTANGTTDSVKCFGNNTGKITLSVSGGTPIYTYVWSNGSSTKDIQNLAAGNYAVTVRDANNCSATRAFTVAQPNAALTANGTTDSVKCFGDNTGKITLSVSGGTPSYTYVWSNGSSTKDIQNLASGNYTVTVRDANNCSATKSFTVAQPNATLTANGTTDSVKCFGNNTGKITLSVSGGTPIYTYVWSNGSSTKDIQNLAAGNYAVTVRDANNCSATKSFTVAQPNAALTANGTTDSVKCFGDNTGKITLSVSGGTPSYTYVWSNGSSTKDIQNLAAGNYAVTVRDANNCSATKSFTVAQPNAALTANGTTDSVKCFGDNTGKITLSVSGGTPSYTYVWSNGSSTKDIQNLAAGNYAVTVRDANNCSATKSFTVAQPNATLTANGTTDSVKCFGNNTGKITLSVSGGTPIYTYVWSNGSSTKDIQNLAAGNYAVTVRDANNCSTTKSFTVAQPSSKISNTYNKTDVSCNNGSNGSITLSPIGGTPPYHYRWNNGNNTATATNLGLGNYFVTVYDANNCPLKDSFKIEQPAAIVLVSNAIQPICFGEKTGEAAIFPTGGVAPYQYVWSNNQTVSAIKNLASGNYQVTVTDANGCAQVKAIQIQSPNAILVQLKAENNLCFGEQKAKIASTVSGGSLPYIYEWSNNQFTNEISNLSNGNYSLTVTDKNGCSVSKFANITSPQAVNVSLQISGINACETLQQATITATPTGGSVPFTFLWSNGSTDNIVRNIPTNSMVQVVVKDKNGCIATAQDSVLPILPLKSEKNAENIGCQNNAKGRAGVNVSGGSKPYRFEWSTGSKNAEIFPQEAGIYQVTITDKNGCTTTAQFPISKEEGITVKTIEAQTIKLGESVELETNASSSNISQWLWIPDDFNSGLDCGNCQSPNAQPKKTTTYQVTAIDNRGCAAIDTVTISVIADHTLYIPNTFSPNGDGSNDTWGIFGNLGGIKEYDLKIFNRWGEKVYESSDPHFQWNGTYQGVLQEPGVFVYYMKVIFVDGLKPDGDGKGSITLIR